MIMLDEAGQPLLEFIAIKRKDNGQWAIPGVRGAAIRLIRKKKKKMAILGKQDKKK